MYGTKAAFDYIAVGGRCAYETNKAFEFPKQPFGLTNSLYTTVHSGIRCDFMDTSSYLEVSFSSAIDSDSFHMLQLVYYVKNVDNLKLKIKWKREGEVDFCSGCYEDRTLEVSQNEFLCVDINLLQNTGWVGKITDLRLYVSNIETVPLFIKYFSVYSPTTYKCSRLTCPYYSKYEHTCDGGKDLHVLLGKFFDGNNIKLNLDSKFEFSIYGIIFIAEFESGYYFLDTVLNKLNNFFDSMPVPCLQVIKEGGKIKLSCDYVKSTLVHTELSEALGFFDSAGSESYTYIIENSGSSDYVDVAGNLKGIYIASELNNLDFNELFDVGFSDDRGLYPTSNFEFSNQTVIFYTLSIPFDGYLNHFELYCQALSDGGKILIYRRSGDVYTVVNSYSLVEAFSITKHTINWLCRVYKGDVIGIYNLKIGTAKHTTTIPINYYGAISGYSTSINKESVEAVSFSSVSLYAYFESPTTNDIPILAVYDEEAYVDKLSFLLNYLDSYSRNFNIIFNNNFNYKITGCQVNAKDSLNVVTEIPGEIIGIDGLSDNIFFDDDVEIELSIHDYTVPADLSKIKDKGLLRYSWNKYIIYLYEDLNYTCTFIPGDVLFYYEFPTIIDIHSVLIHSAEEEVVDNYLLEVLDNTKTSPSFSNPNDVVILNQQMNNWRFDIDNGISTEGVGVFVYNYGELPNISFSEIELFTKIGSIPSYIINTAGIVRDDQTIPFGLESVGTKNDVYIGVHLKSLLINIGFITDERMFSFDDINVYSSFIPDNYFVSESGAGEGALTIYNVRSKALKCYLLDYSINFPTNLIYEYDFDNSILHKGFVPTQYTHSKFYFVSGNYINNKYTTYALKNMINVEDFFVTKFYDFKAHEYDDWYVPYDYLVPGKDGEFVYIDGGLKLKPLTNEAIRWFNYINVNEFYNDIDIELKFNYVGNIEDFVYIGLTCCDKNYDNYLKFYSAFQAGSEYGLEFKLVGDADPTYYKLAATVGRDIGLRINKRGSNWTFSCFYNDAWHELITFSLFDTEILISLSTMFNAPHIESNVIAEFVSCEIKASKVVYGKKVWYTINDGLDYIYSGNVLDDSILLDNINKSLTFCRDYTIKKFVYNFNTTSIRYLKFMNEATKSIKITEIKCYIDDMLVPIQQGYVSYSDDLFFGILNGETSYLDDSVIINYDLSNAIRKGGDEVLSAVGVDFGDKTEVNKTVLYYIEETGLYEPCRLMYSYDNVIYYDVYDNFSLFSRTAYTSAHYLFNEFVGYKGKNEIVYDFISNDQYSTDFSEEEVKEYKWSISSPYVVDSGGVWLKHLTGSESLYSKFSIDGDFTIDMYFDNFSNYSSGEALIFLKIIFKNNTYYDDVYIKQRFDNHTVYTRFVSYNMEAGRTAGGLRIKRIGSVFYYYYRRYGTTWYEVGSYDYGYDYVYPVDINVCLSGDNSFDLRIKKILVTEGIGIADTDLELLESPGLSTLFIRGRQFSSNDTYAVADSWSMTKPTYPFSFSWLGSISSSISLGGLLVSKPYSIGLTYEEKDLSLWWFSEYLTKYKIDDALSYSSDVNTLSSLSVGNYKVNENLFTSTSDQTIKAIYKSRYDVNTIIDETFKTGEGTFDTVFSGSGSVEYMSDNFTGNDGDLYNQTLWSGSTSNIEIENNRLHIEYCADHVYIDTKYKPVDDFNVQVDFEADVTGGSTTNWSQQLVVYFENGNRFDIRRQGNWVGSNGGYRTTTCVDNNWTVLSYYVAPDDAIGKLRITKKGNTLSSYFLQNDRWFYLDGWTLTSGVAVSGIRLEHSSWDGVTALECYFDTFIVNDDFDFYSDVKPDGYSYVGGSYIKLIGGNIHTNKLIHSINALTFECSVTVDYDFSYSYTGLCVSDVPFCVGGINETGCKNIHISYNDGAFLLYVDGESYRWVCDNANTLFYPIHGQTYIIGIKFIPGTGTLIYWFGPTNGYFLFDYIMSGNLHAWWGNQYGNGVYESQISTVHRFRCFEDRVLYKELINTWSNTVGIDDIFTSSDGSSPDFERWVINGSPKIYNNFLKLISGNGDKIQSKAFFCAPFEIILEYNNLSFAQEEELALSLNVECYNSYKNKALGVSKFKVGYSGGVGAWVNYYCSGLSGNSSIYHTSDVSNRKLKIVNDGYNIQYFLSDGNGWITVFSIDCIKQYYYKVSIEGTDSGIIAYLDNITIDSEESMTPTDAVALVPTAWKFSPTNKAYCSVTYINLNELVDRCRHFSIDVVAKIDDSIFLSYIEMDKDLVSFDGAKIVGDNYITLISAMDAAENGEVIYVLPGTYDIGGYTINKKIIIVGVGDYRDINIVISSTVKLDGCEIIFKNITMLNQMAQWGISFKTRGDEISYFVMDNCKCFFLNTWVSLFRGDGSKEYYVYFRDSYIGFNVHCVIASIGINYQSIILDIFNCRILCDHVIDLFYYSGAVVNFRLCSLIYADIPEYEPEVINTIPILTLFSPHGNTNIYLNTPKGLEKIITSKENEFNYLSFGNTLGGVTFYGGDNDYYFSEYLMPPVDNSFRLFIQGYIDTIRVFDRYQTYNETLNNINTVNDLGINLKLAHNDTVVDYKCYEPLNIYNSGLYFGRNTSSIIDEFIWSKTKTSSSDLLLYYSNYLSKLGYANCSIDIYNTQYKFFIDFGSTVGIGSLVQSQANNFLHTNYYSDDTDDPSLINTPCFLYDARWYVLSNTISYSASSLTPGVFSVFPTISGCDESRWGYSGEYGYIDLVPDSVLSVDSSLTGVYNIKWKRNKTNINDYMLSSFSDSLTINLKLFGGGTCSRIVIKSGYDVGTEYVGYIIKCSMVVDSTVVFSIENNINSTIVAEFDSVSFTTIDLIIQEVKQTSEFFFNGTHLAGNVVFINYVKVLSPSTTRKFDSTLCNVYELETSLKLDSIDTSKTGTCSLNYCSSNQFMNECVLASSLDLNNLPNDKFVSVLAISDNLYDCGFIVNEYTVSVPPETMTGSIDSWKVYIGDAELYEEFFYIQGISTSIGVRFFKSTVFEIGTYHEQFGMNEEWSVTDELVLGIYSVNNIDNFYLCIGAKDDGRYYRWDFSLVSGWNNFRFNFYDSRVTKYVFNTLTDNLLFNDLDIFNVWFGGTYSHESGILVLDNIFVDRSSIENVLSSNKDAFYIPVYFESDSGNVQLDYTTYWGSDGKIFGNILSDKVLLTVFSDEVSFSLVNKLSGEFVLGAYSYKHDVRTVKRFGKAYKFDINNKTKLKLDWYCKAGCFWAELYVNGFLVGRIQFNLIEINELKVTGVMVGGSPVYITSIYDSLSLCGQLNYIKIYSSNAESELINDTLIIDGKNLVENSPMYIGKIEPSDYIRLPVLYKGKSKQLSQLNLKIQWVGNY